MYRTAMLAGASGGIGREIARFLATKAHRLVLIGRDAYKLRLAADYANAAGVNAEQIIVQVDVGDIDKVRGILENHPRVPLNDVDILVNCAGITNYGTSDIHMTDFMQMLQTNLVGPCNLMSTVLPFMREQNSGLIVNVISMSAFRARPHMGGYAASQFGLRGYCESLRKELASSDVRVATICPGFVATKLTTDVVKDLDPTEMIQPMDIVKSLDFMLALPATIDIPEIRLDCMNQINRPEGW